MVTPGVPIEVDDLSPDWFTSVFRLHEPDASVSSVTVTDAHSGTTGRVKLQIHYERVLGDLPHSIFCKIAPFDMRQREFLRHLGIGAMEARFYESLAGEVPVRVPRVWYSEFGDDGSFVMVLEDLETSHCTFPRPADPDNIERAMSTVEELGHLHATYWETPRFSEDLAWVPDRAGFGAAGGKDRLNIVGAGRFIERAIELFADTMPPVFRTVGTLYADRAPDILDIWDEGERTLVHGDAHSGNLFTDQGRTGFFDWAMFSHSPGMRDVAYYCCNSLPTDVRRAIQGDLLIRYRTTLADHAIDFDSELAEHQLRLFAVFSWVSAASTAAMGDRWQPSDRAMAAMARTTTALEDLDSAGLLLELLA